MARAPYDEMNLRKILVYRNCGRKRIYYNERTGIRPTLELNGIWGGTLEKVQNSASIKSICQNICPPRTEPNLNKITEILINHLQKSPCIFTVKAPCIMG